MPVNSYKPEPKITVPMGVLIAAFGLLLDEARPEATNIGLPVSIAQEIIARLGEIQQQTQAADFYRNYLGGLIYENERGAIG